jgi:hypothetical protein
VYDPARGLVEHGLRVDAEFRHLGPPLSEDDRDVLEEVAVYRRPYREPLIVWKDHGVVLDGHYRFELCLKYGAPFAIVEKELPDRQAARDWILARLYRNRPCTVLGATYLWGLWCLRQDRRGRGGEPGRLRLDLGRQDVPGKPGTAARYFWKCRPRLADMLRAAALVAAVDRLGVRCGGLGKSFVLAAESGFSCSDVTAWLDIMDPRKQQETVGQLMDVAEGRHCLRYEGEPLGFVVPHEPVALAERLVDQLGREGAWKVVRAVMGLVGDKKLAARSQ